MVEPLTIRAVVFEDQGWWVAQCLEYDLCTATRNRDDLPRQFLSQVQLQIIADLSRSREPFQDLPQAPQKFWDLYSSVGMPIEMKWKESLFHRLARFWRRVPRLQAEVAFA
ncbi:MAG TPA: hypothetical protein VIA62_22200 [Thermoanaerobaculia bacterium]|jgi:hypothetical protein|nr:hypothetical protein [Thermoanaerobaculia bacterium]